MANTPSLADFSSCSPQSLSFNSVVSVCFFFTFFSIVCVGKGRYLCLFGNYIYLLYKCQGCSAGGVDKRYLCSIMWLLVRSLLGESWKTFLP